MAKEWPFSLDMLPVQGITSPAANIEFIRGRLINTLTILDGVLKAPSGLSGDLKQMVYNVRFHVVAGIGLCDAALRAGFSYLEPASTVDGLLEAVDQHIYALQAARPIWNAWVRAARTQESGLGAAEPAIPAPIRSRFMAMAAKPITTPEYIGASMATAGLYGLRRSFGADGMVNLPTDIAAGLQQAVKNDPTITGPAAPAPSTTSSLTMLVVGLGIGYFLFKKKK